MKKVLMLHWLILNTTHNKKEYLEHVIMSAFQNNKLYCVA